MLAYIDFPSWITPEVFGFLKLSPGNLLNLLRWYGLMYIIGIVISYIQSLYILEHDNIKTIDKKILDDFYFWAIIGLVLGGRIFSCLIYDFEYYSRNLLEIIFPFKDGVFVGFQGMAYHGAVLGVFVVGLVFVRTKKINFRELNDLIFPVVPLGYTFGRLANFINQELWGKITASPIGIFFPNADLVPVATNEVSKVMNKLGWSLSETAEVVTNNNGEVIKNVLGEIPIENNFGVIVDSIKGINLPRHPSQLYEAFFEGIFLFLILWFPARRYKPFKGFMAPVYLGGYAIVRFFIEYFRQPDSQFGDFASGKYTGYISGNISMGQILSVIMLCVAIGVGYYFYTLSKKDELTLETKKKKKSKR